MPWYEIYDEADARRRERIRAHGGVIAPSGAVLYPDKPRPTPPQPSPPAPIMPPEPVTPAVPGLLALLVSLITRR